MTFHKLCPQALGPSRQRQAFPENLLKGLIDSSSGMEVNRKAPMLVGAAQQLAFLAQAHISAEPNSCQLKARLAQECFLPYNQTL